mmetsp:Transcript_35140/g.65104  ORF Transcript_35140/g.65104 Transcript_35140/m.65104 type:complete len:205 (-) Transcript_35140:866-1480(-)
MCPHVIIAVPSRSLTSHAELHPLAFCCASHSCVGSHTSLKLSEELCSISVHQFFAVFGLQVAFGVEHNNHWIATRVVTSQIFRHPRHMRLGRERHRRPWHFRIVTLEIIFGFVITDEDRRKFLLTRFLDTFVCFEKLRKETSAPLSTEVNSHVVLAFNHRLGINFLALIKQLVPEQVIEECSRALQLVHLASNLFMLEILLEDV